MKRPSPPVLLAATLLLAALGGAQTIKPEEVVEVRAEPAQVSMQKGAAASATLVATIKEGFHVNSNKPVQDYLIPSRVELLESPAFALEKQEFPAGELKSFGFSDEQLSVYEGTLRVPFKLRAKPEATPGAHTLRLAFHYQACNDKFCLRPAQREATLKVHVK